MTGHSHENHITHTQCGAKLDLSLYTKHIGLDGKGKMCFSCLFFFSLLLIQIQVRPNQIAIKGRLGREAKNKIVNTVGW